MPRRIRRTRSRSTFPPPPSQLQLEITGSRPTPVLENVSPYDVSYRMSSETPAEFSASVARFGVVQPIAVVRNEATQGLRPFTVIDGRRRLEAAHRNSIQSIPALVYPVGTNGAFLSSLTLATNFHRTSNLLSELQATEYLIGRGATEDDLVTTLGIPRVKAIRLMQLSMCSSVIHEGIRTRQLSESAAIAYLRLGNPENRSVIHSLLGDGDRVTVRQIRDLIRLEGNLLAHSQLEIAPEAIRPGRTEDVSVRHMPDGSVQVLVLGQQYVPMYNLNELVTQRTTTITDLELDGTWNAVLRLLEAAQNAQPVSASDESDRFFGDLNALTERAGGLATIEVQEPPRVTEPVEASEAPPPPPPVYVTGSTSIDWNSFAAAAPTIRTL